MSQDLPFENAFKKLEVILDRMNSSEASLDDSIKLYEEADTLISQCTKRLNEAEGRIEKLVKGREGELQTDEAGTPLTKPLDSTC